MLDALLFLLLIYGVGMRSRIRRLRLVRGLRIERDLLERLALLERLGRRVLLKRTFLALAFSFFFLVPRAVLGLLGDIIEVNPSLSHIFCAKFLLFTLVSNSFISFSISLSLAPRVINASILFFLVRSKFLSLKQDPSDHAFLGRRNLKYSRRVGGAV